MAKKGANNHGKKIKAMDKLQIPRKREKKKKETKIVRK